MFYKTISYIEFLVKSTNQHGVHSPFVYDFITKGLYKKANKTAILNNYTELKNLSIKEQKVLSKIVNYYKIDKIYFDFISLENDIHNNLKLLFINILNHNNFLKNNARYFVIINEIHKNKTAYSIWKKLIKNKEATVTIDLFYFGLIFFRKEQVKEHFNIRV
jgi:hypothetical protein